MSDEIVKSKSTELARPALDMPALFQKAMELGPQGPEMIRQLVALKVEEDKRQAEHAFADALREFQHICPPIPKEKEVYKDEASRKGGKPVYSYAPLDAIMAHVRPHLEATGLSVSFDTHSKDASMVSVTCLLHHVGGHTRASVFEVPTESRSSLQSPQQKFASAMTFAKRHALTNVLGIPTTDDFEEDDVDPTTLNEEQQANLRAKIEEVGAVEAKVLAWLKADAISSVRVADLERCYAELDRFAAKGGAA